MTLRDLAYAKANALTLEQWQNIARASGLGIGPDTILSEADREKLIMAYQVYQKNGGRAVGGSRNTQGAAESSSRTGNAGDSGQPGKGNDAKARNELKKLVSQNYIFIDTNSIMVPNAEEAFKNIVQVSAEAGKKINILSSSLFQIAAWSKDSGNEKRRVLAQKRLQQLKTLQSEGYLSIRDVPSMGNNTSASDLVTICSRFRMDNPLLVITQSRQLAEDLLSLNRQGSAYGKTIVVRRINKNGYLSNVLTKTDNDKGFFRICTEVRKEPDRALRVTQIPCSGDTVFAPAGDKWQNILLGEEIGHGGEGSIYLTDTKYVAKIYKKECCTNYRLEKLKLMIQAGLNYAGICFPKAILVNQNREFVGYLMDKAEGYSIQSSIFRKALFMKKLPGWKKEDLVQCAITILCSIRYLHQNNILIGDINPNNFLVKSPTEVFLVDTDSFQINDLPCPVGFPLFTAPEIHARYRKDEFHEYSEILRTRENEYFAVATLMFMLMLPGKPPYTQQGGENIVDNILEMHFPYAVGTKHGEKVPEGTWRFIWSHLTRRMKENFDRVFNKYEDSSEYNIEERLSVEAWLKEMREYRSILEKWSRELKKDPNTTDADPKSLELYPDALKRIKGVKYVKCRGEGCTKEYPEDDYRLKAGFCPECLNKGETVTCYSCGNPFIFTNYLKYYKKLSKPPIMCPDCRKKKDEIIKRYRCAELGCNEYVVITRGDMAYFMSQNYSLPKKCPKCRNDSSPRVLSSKKKYSAPPTGAYEKKSSLTGGGATYGKGSSGKSGCFITTAVCGYLGKADDCRELMAFRDFRDNWLRYQPGGEELIREYYRTAPELVRQMHMSSDYSAICDTLWDEYLAPCYDMIQDGELEKCRDRYIAMVGYLEEQVSGNTMQDDTGRRSS